MRGPPLICHAPLRVRPDNLLVREKGRMMDDSATGSGAQRDRHAQVLRLVYGAQVAQIIYVAAKLGIPDLLAASAQTTGNCPQQPKARSRRCVVCFVA